MSVYAPGRDTDPNFTDNTTRQRRRTETTYLASRGETGGVFAKYLQGSTPKYARNQGIREDTQQRDTLARIFIRVDADEFDLFKNSIGDLHTRVNLIPRLVGIFTNPVQRRTAQTQGQQNPPRQQPDVYNTGYLDFLITNTQHTLQEKVQVSETLADNWVAYYFGQSAPQWQYSGVLINSVQDDQASNFFRLYLEVLRGTQLARRQKAAILKYDSYNVVGSMCNLQMTYKSDNELIVPFGFTFLVKKILITNYTAGWRPVSANTPFATDVNAVPFDGRPLSELQRTAIAMQTPLGTEEVPVPQQSIDVRVESTPPEEVSSTASGENNLPFGIVSVERPPGGYFNATLNYASRPETVNAPGVINLNPDVRPSRPPVATGSDVSGVSTDATAPGAP